MDQFHEKQEQQHRRGAEDGKIVEDAISEDTPRPQFPTRRHGVDDDGDDQVVQPLRNEVHSVRHLHHQDGMPNHATTGGSAQAQVSHHPSYNPSRVHNTRINRQASEALNAGSASLAPPLRNKEKSTKAMIVSNVIVDNEDEEGSAAIPMPIRNSVLRKEASVGSESLSSLPNRNTSNQSTSIQPHGNNNDKDSELPPPLKNTALRKEASVGIESLASLPTRLADHHNQYQSAAAVTCDESVEDSSVTNSPKRTSFKKEASVGMELIKSLPKRKSQDESNLNPRVLKSALKTPSHETLITSASSEKAHKGDPKKTAALPQQQGKNESSIYIGSKHDEKKQQANIVSSASSDDDIQKAKSVSFDLTGDLTGEKNKEMEKAKLKAYEASAKQQATFKAYEASAKQKATFKAYEAVKQGRRSIEDANTIKDPEKRKALGLDVGVSKPGASAASASSSITAGSSSVQDPEKRQALGMIDENVVSNSALVTNLNDADAAAMARRGGPPPGLSSASLMSSTSTVVPPPLTLNAQNYYTPAGAFHVGPSQVGDDVNGDEVIGPSPTSNDPETAQTSPSLRDSGGEDSMVQVHAVLINEPSQSYGSGRFFSFRSLRNILVEARPLEREDTLRQLFHNETFLCLLFLGLMILILVVVGLSVGLTIGKKPNNNDKPLMSPLHTVAPTVAPHFIDLLPYTTERVIYFEPNSSQSLAYHWMQNDTMYDNYTTTQKFQRFVLATLYYNTNNGTKTWHNSENWVEYEHHECDWFSRSVTGPCITLVEDDDNNSRILTTLQLEDNGLYGELPRELGLLSRLIALDLNTNFISGILPSSIGKITTLAHLELGHNFLSGSIPSEVGGLTRLRGLGLSSNMFKKSIPTQILNLVQLEALTLNNNELSGTIPPNFGNQLSKLDYIEINDNLLSGSIPSSFGLLTKLEYLYLENNRFVSTIPSEIGDLIKLGSLLLHNNQLKGTIPTNIGRMESLQVLRLDKNNLSGPIPSEIGQLSNNLSLLYLNGNNIKGSIPSTMGMLNQVLAFGVTRNRISGGLPSEIGNMIQLEELYCSYNQITGSIPSEVGNLIRLFDLNLANNQIRGPIPTELGQLHANLTFLELQENQLSGTIPSEIGRLTNVMTMKLDNNQLTGTIPSQLAGNNNKNNINFVIMKLEALYLHNNKLRGTIPSELGELPGLVELTLYNNNGLSGVVPPELCVLVASDILQLTIDCSVVKCTCGCICWDDNNI